MILENNQNLLNRKRVGNTKQRGAPANIFKEVIMTGPEGREQDSGSKSVGEFVAADYRTAKVFEKYGIDFCCGGKVALSDACREKGIDPGMINGR